VASLIRGVVRGAALVTALAVVAPAVWADGVVAPPQVRVQSPGGVTANVRILPPVGSPSDNARLQPPGGVTSNARIQPPVGITQLFLNWLRARIGVPIG
jgi:hypothetical protein